MSEIEYSQLAGHITEKLDNTTEYEDWLIIQNYVEELQGNLTKEQLAYINLKDTFNNLQQDNQQLKILVENLELEVTLNEEQEKLLDSILFGSDEND